MTLPDNITMCRTALAAASQANDAALSTHYFAAARVAFTKAREELAALERLLIAREREIAHSAQPRQLAFEKDGRE